MRLADEWCSLLLEVGELIRCENLFIYLAFSTNVCEVKNEHGKEVENVLLPDTLFDNNFAAFFFLARAAVDLTGNDISSIILFNIQMSLSKDSVKQNASNLAR